MAHEFQTGVEPFDFGDLTFAGYPVGFDPGAMDLTLGGQPFVISLEDLSRLVGPTPFSQPFPQFTGSVLDFGFYPNVLSGMLSPQPFRNPLTGDFLSGFDPLALVQSGQFERLDPTLLDEVFVTPEGKVVNAQGQEDPSLWERITKIPGLGRTLLMLGIGGLGVGAATLLSGEAPELPIPTAPPPSPAQTAARAAVTRALTQPLTRALTEPVEGAQQPGIPGPPSTGTAALGLSPYFPSLAIAQASQPGTTASEDLEALFRSAIAGQRNLAALGLQGSARELVGQAEAAPLERDIRLQALGMIPGLLGVPSNVAAALQTGQSLSNLIASQLAPLMPTPAGPALMQGGNNPVAAWLARRQLAPASGPSTLTPVQRWLSRRGLA